jgi:hypothetical protein
MERYTPSGIAYMIECHKRKLDELHDQRVATAHRRQDEHPRYMQMTESEFKIYIIEAIRYNLRKAKEIENEIKQLEGIRF